MWGNLFDYWKSFSFLGTISLPVLGLFFLGTKSFNWSIPSGYYTRLKMFINNKKNTVSGTSSTNKVADLVVEYPTTKLDKASYWKYCLPKKSQLSKKANETTASAVTSEEECQLDWNKSSNSELINYLLNLGLKFLKLRHQINLLSIYALGDKVKESNPFKDEMIKKCRLKGRSDQKYLKDFFISETPISKHCLLVPQEVTLNLDVESNSAQQDSSQQTEIKLEELKKGKISGGVKYSLSDYWGKLQDFSETRVGGSVQKGPISIQVLGKDFEFELNGTTESTEGQNGKLDFEALFKKYEKKELEVCDFWKNFPSMGGQTNKCANKFPSK